MRCHEQTRAAFWQVAVPALAEQDGPLPRPPCFVVCHVSALEGLGRPPGGPLGRAKPLLDALHDHRGTGPWYRDLPGHAPLVDDDPSHVRGLAVEVKAGEPRTEYVVGADLSVAGRVVAEVPVEASAPNDIAGTVGEKAKIAAGRVAFAAAVRRGFAPFAGLSDIAPVALVVRHQPQRDEDNTWATWIAAMCGVRTQGASHWSRGAPLAGWSPTAVASIAEPRLHCPVVYELWA